MYTPADCEAILKGKPRKKIDHNTYLSRCAVGYTVTLYDTPIVTICDDGRYVLNSGGFRTVTTKDRLNKFGPVKVYQADGVWYAGGELFTDGMVITPKL